MSPSRITILETLHGCPTYPKDIRMLKITLTETKMITEDIHRIVPSNL